jgi:Uma2 family endonuclease
LKRDKWDALTQEEKEKFAPVCPDFVVEFCTDYDDWRQLQTKMQEYLDNGCQLGWLIDLNDWQVEIYRIGKKIEVLNNPENLEGEDVLPGFILDLAAIT